MLQMALSEPYSTDAVYRCRGLRPGIELIKAVTANEKKPAASLITEEYHRMGYFPENHEGKVSQVLESLGSYNVWVARNENKEVLATLGYTTKDRLPMDMIFSEELNQIRSQGIRVAEMGMFACRLKKCALIIHLMSKAFQDAASVVDGIAIAIHPNHLDKQGKRDSFGLYVDQLGFRLLHPEPRFYPRVSAPAYGLYARISDIRKHSQRVRAFAGLV